MVFMNTIQLLCRNITAIIIAVIHPCLRHVTMTTTTLIRRTSVEEPQPVERTILAYIWGGILTAKAVLSSVILSWIISIKWRQDGTTVMQEAFMFTLIRRPWFVQFENPVLLK